MSEAQKVKSQLVIVVGLLVLRFIFKTDYLVYAALAVGLIFLIIPALGDLIIKGWFKIGELLGYVNSRIILSVLFYLFLTPFAFLQKLFSKSTIQLKDEPGSVFHNRNHQYEAKDFEDIW
jgi:hypothetical protein